MSVGPANAVRPSPPPAVSAELASGVGRALQHLPDELLQAMARGLVAHADELAPGVLFRGSSSGGCAVGITLRELAPDAFEFGVLRFWLWQRWRRGVERDVARRYPRLKHLQWYFDEAVAEVRETGCVIEPAKAIGLWFAACAQSELTARRKVAEKQSQPRRAHQLASGLRRGRRREAERTRAARHSEARP